MTKREFVTIRLSQRQFILLRKIFESRAPNLLDALRDGSNVVIPVNQRRTIQDIVEAEFCESGLNDDDEPNAHGLELEELIDAFGPHK